MANKNIEQIKNQLGENLTDSQKDRDVVDFSNNVSNFLQILMDSTTIADDLFIESQKGLLERLKDTNNETAMSDGARIELHKTLIKGKTDNANVIANIIKGMADALLLKKGLEGFGGQGGSEDLTKNDIDAVKEAIKDISDLRQFIDEIKKTEK